MKTLGFLLWAAVIVPTAKPASLAVSTYLKDGLTPTAMASDSAGNVYLAGNAFVARLDPTASQYLYLTYFDAPASDRISSLAVDAAGDAYIAGWTSNPDFPNSGTLGTAPTSSTDTRAFVARLNPDGKVAFSVLIGGATPAQAAGIAVTPAGQILISGVAGSSGFPHTSGAYAVDDSTGHWFLMELDAGASRMIFSATGIGGSSIALDASGNIFLAGSSPGTDYPTTPGAYQTALVQGYFHTCIACLEGVPPGPAGNLQHLTNVNPDASKLIYSTGVNDPTGATASITTTGLAIDAAGNAYLTGNLSGGAQYPFTATPPNQYYSGYLTKLDPAGAKVLFSIPAGGSGVQLDSSGAVYVGGIVSSYSPPVDLSPLVTTPVALPAIFSWIPRPCRPDNITAISGAYVMRVDAATATVLDGQWIDGSAPGAAAINLVAGKVWITGGTPTADVPVSPGGQAPGIGPGSQTGAYLSAVDFSSGVNRGPAIACVLDGGNLSHAGAITGRQLLSIFGTNLGPAAGAAPPDGADTSVAGVSAMFNGVAAPLLYVSASQINLVVPAAPPSAMVMQLTVNGATLRRQFLYTASNLNLFADLSTVEAPCPNAIAVGGGFHPIATNADGSMNSCANPAKYGSTVSFYMHGAGVDTLSNVQAFAGSCPVTVTDTSLIGSLVYKVDVTLPASRFWPCTNEDSSSAENSFFVTFSYNGSTVGPRMVPGPTTAYTALTGGTAPAEAMPMTVWVTR